MRERRQPRPAPASRKLCNGEKGADSNVRALAFSANLQRCWSKMLGGGVSMAPLRPPHIEQSALISEDGFNGVDFSCSKPVTSQRDT